MDDPLARIDSHASLVDGRIVSASVGHTAARSDTPTSANVKPVTKIAHAAQIR